MLICSSLCGALVKNCNAIEVQVPINKYITRKDNLVVLELGNAFKIYDMTGDNEALPYLSMYIVNMQFRCLSNTSFDVKAQNLISPGEYLQFLFIYNREISHCLNVNIEAIQEYKQVKIIRLLDLFLQFKWNRVSLEGYSNNKLLSHRRFTILKGFTPKYNERQSRQ
jgi:hypothetical protein